MSNKGPRVFEAKQAEREQVPLLLGLVGPSGGGKTYSALRLAKGIQQIVGGKIFGIDTEARRMLHYADQFDFQHVEFGEPFGSLDYLEALRYCEAQGAGVIIVDSMSHEHEGPGGLLEQHEAETTRISKGDENRREAVKMLAWAKPKAARRRLINSILQMHVPAMIFCFRAKEKVLMQKGKDPQNLGWMPIAGEEFIYEMTANALLLPTANGCPTWNPTEKGEKQMVKLPGQFSKLTGQLDEDMGRTMALWASGAEGKLRRAHRDGKMAEVWQSLSPQLKRALTPLKDELKAQQPDHQPEPQP